ncbi:MAG: NAD(P)H-binding protein [Candidatus Tectomicrobia bacterium]|uniref:NAD(P)H-binding protein n=1 Tax=Tectimicrobiota bacterium TaxID=2528274 RepID=A0A932HZ45_UNCTE|nr:NAD(P)H-binding protein [Candidatus Tectomicrobia bacterium]
MRGPGRTARSGTIDIVITGANGAVGQGLIRHLGRSSTIVPTRLRALVRSLERSHGLRPLDAEVIEVRYGDPASVRACIEGADAVVHLAGALLPRPPESLIEANTDSTRAVAEAARAAGAKHFVYLSFPGADPASRNGYLRSKGFAEEILRQKPFSGAIFRVPMILGPGCPSMRKLRQLAGAPLTPLVSGGSVRLQPIALADVLGAIEWALSLPPDEPLKVLDLVGPETISYADLLRRVGQRVGKRPRIFPIPRAAGWLTAALMGLLAPSLGWNRSVFDILFKEHLGDASLARAVVPFPLTPVNETLDQALSPGAG